MKSVLLGFVIFFVLLIINVIAGEEIHWNSNLLLSFQFTMLYTVCIYFGNALVFIALDKIFKHDRFPLKRLLLGFGVSFAITVGIIFVMRIFEEVVVEGKSMGQFISEERMSNYLVSLIIFFFISLGIHAFYFYKAYQENKVKEQKIIAGTASAKFESLKNQIDPHFLFNSLNVLSSLIEENPDSAQKFTTSLSKIYRYVLEQKDKELVPVEEELSFAKTYMNLLKMRFENSLFYELPDVAPDPEMKVVPLSLQLLLENTVKHNIVSEKKPLHIRITIENDYLVIQNDFQKKENLQDRQGVGLQNIVSRYAIITKRKVRVEQNEQTFTVSIPILTRQINVMETEKIEEDSYYKIRKRVEDIKGFYSNLGAYVVVIIGLAILNLVTYPKFLWFIFPLVGWGLGVVVHGLTVFNYMPFLGRDWEEKKIQQLIDKEKSQTWK
ncbi:MAG TPA: 2TM domain-containing protein [Flavobacterium sp.]|nr:2TM domain-containing protein [Flavobacterium sp.]